MEKANRNYVAAYIKSGEAADTRSMHLALQTEEGWQELNFGVGVLFAEADFESKPLQGITMVMEKAYLYRKESGRIGVAAQIMTVDGKRKDQLCFWETEDLVHFQRVSGEKRTHDRETELVELEAGGEKVIASILEITLSEANYLQKKLGKVQNISVEPVEVHIPVGQRLTNLPCLKAHYSDGSIEEIPVEWDKGELEAVSFDKEGIYTVTGQAVVKDYAAPLIQGIADPMIRWYKGRYYLIGTNEFTEGRHLYIRCAKTIEELPAAEPCLIFQATGAGDHSGCNWAPELHIIGGKLCCLFASSTNGEWTHVQSRIMYCSGDPMRREAWSEPVRVRKANGDFLIENGITLDMTYFEAAGQSYYCWAQRSIDERGTGTSDLMLARVNPEKPELLAGEPVLLCRPAFAWDRQHTEVDEGPCVLKHDGRIYLSYSGDSVSDYYCISWLIAEENAELLNPASWKRTGYPVLGREHVEGERGPGHNSFTTDEYGRDVLVYHAKPNGGMRSFYARTIHYSFDGTPLLYLTAEQFLKPEFRKVTARIVVEKSAYLFVHFREKTTPDGEQVYFGLSRDGFHWEKVNEGQPVLWAYYGDKGVRDFTVTRCENNGKFYILATDLSLSYGMRNQYHHSWKEIGRNGSCYFSMWESEDLVHWNEQKLICMGGEELGCRWAPDILHDVKTGEYIIHWSSPHSSDDYGKKAIYCSRTWDFRKFSAPEVLYRKEDSGVIDSAMYEEDGKYYLFVKSEKNPCGVIMLVSDSATGPFEKMEGFEESLLLEKPEVYEAPTAVRLKNGQWGLFLDYFGVKGDGQGYVPFVTGKLASGVFHRSEEEFNFPYGFKHGTIMAITQSEYERMKAFDWSDVADGR